MNKRFLLVTLCAVLALAGCKKDTLAPSKDPSADRLAAGSTSLITPVKPGPIGVCYVEVNNNNLLNVGAYTLKTGGQQLFDAGIIFAANIHYDVSQGRHTLYCNNNVSKVLANRDTYIQPLQNKGIKVLLDILGDHQGAGICNLTSRVKARDFANQMANAVYTYGLDGVDFDDEYADYGANGTGQPNDSSFVMLVEELRTVMPDKIISFYYYGPAASHLSWNGKRVGDYADYSWNAIYGTYSPPNVPPLGKDRLGPAAVWINNTPALTARTMATQTVVDGYGVYLYYDLHGYNEAGYLSYPSTGLYNDSTALTGTIQSWAQGTNPASPAVLSATNLTGTAATLNWSSVTGVSSYDVDYKPVGSSTWISAATGITSTSVNISGLTNGAEYHWRVKCNSNNGSSVYSFAQFVSAQQEPPPPASTGVKFFQDINYGGASTQAIPKGNYTLAQLQAYGFVDDWASSVQIPAGWTVIMYSNDRFKRTSWTLTSSNSDFTRLSPGANDVVTSVKIQ